MVGENDAGGYLENGGRLYLARHGKAPFRSLSLPGSVSPGTPDMRQTSPATGGACIGNQKQRMPWNYSFSCRTAAKYGLGCREQCGRAAAAGSDRPAYIHRHGPEHASTVKAPASQCDKKRDRASSEIEYDNGHHPIRSRCELDGSTGNTAYSD